MDSFGLGLMLNFVDNASGGMSTATSNFRSMSAMADQVTGSVNLTSQAVAGLSIVGATMSQLGDTFTNAGSSIISSLASMTQRMTSMGTELLGTRMNLTALYGSAEAGEKKFAEAQQYAKDSIFELKEILPSITMMKAVGIEAMADVTTSVGKQTQKLMDYAADLSAMFPTMRNAYGTGVQAAMGALKEYIAEGNAISLKRGAGLDITAILGEDKGNSIEVRTQQVADLIEKMNIFGLTAQMVGTPTQMLSNISDILYNNMIKLVDSGVYDEYSKIVQIFYDGVNALESSGDLAVLAQIFGEAIVSLIEPIKAVAEKIVELANAFTAFIKEHPQMAKTIIKLTAVAGVALVVMGVALKLAGSFFVLVAAFKMLNIWSSGQFAVTRSLAVAFRALSSVFLPVILAVITFKKIWEKNIFGVRDSTFSVVGDIKTLFALIFDAWDNNTLSYENFDKANQLGILPFISSLLDLKQNFSDFIAGFKAGFDSVFSYLDRMSEKVEPIKISVMGMAKSVGDLLSKFTGFELSGAWTDFGDIIGKLVGILAIAIPVVKILAVVIGALTSPVGLVIAGLSLMFIAWDKNLFGIQEKTSKALGFVKSTFEKIFPQIRETVGKAWEQIWGKLQETYETTLKPILAGIGQAFNNVIMKIKDFWDRYGLDIVRGIGGFVMSVVGLFQKLWFRLQPVFMSLFAIVSELWNNHLSPFIGKLLNFIGSVISVILFLWNSVLSPIIGWLVDNFLPPFMNVFLTIADVVGNVIANVVDVIGNIIQVLTGIIDFIVGVFTGDVDKALQGVADIFEGAWGLIWGVIKGTINLVIDGLNLLWSGIYSAVSSIVNTVGDIATALGDLFGKDWGWHMPSYMPKIPRLNTGGYIKEEGVSVLHPNEVVVNSEETDSLREFLTDYKKGRTVPTAGNNGSNDNSQNDYSVTFETGAIQFIIQKATTNEAEIKAMAIKFMKEIERQMQLQQMTRTNKSKSKVVFV